MQQTAARRASNPIPQRYARGMTTQMTVRLSDESASFIDDQVQAGAAPSRAAALDRLVRREIRRARALEDALVYAREGEDPELAGFHEAATRNRLARTPDPHVDR